jgi:4-hydroxy-tetrahydrodipicolinate synthase
VEEAAGRAPVVAHIGEVSTRETRRLGQQIARLGVDAVSAITPWFVPLKQEELINHYTAIADALSVPLFFTTFPPAPGTPLPRRPRASWPGTRISSALRIAPAATTA